VLPVASSGLVSKILTFPSIVGRQIG